MCLVIPGSSKKTAADDDEDQSASDPEFLGAPPSTACKRVCVCVCVCLHMCEARSWMHLSQRFSCVRSQVASQAFILCNCLCCWPVIPKDLVPDDMDDIEHWDHQGLLVCMHDHACKHQVMQVSLLVCQSSHKYGSIAQVMQVSVYICMPILCCKYSTSPYCGCHGSSPGEVQSPCKSLQVSEEQVGAPPA